MIDSLNLVNFELNGKNKLVKKTESPYIVEYNGNPYFYISITFDYGGYPAYVFYNDIDNYYLENSDGSLSSMNLLGGNEDREFIKDQLSSLVPGLLN